jgi:hypothetical protein
MLLGGVFDYFRPIYYFFNTLLFIVSSARVFVLAVEWALPWLGIQPHNREYRDVRTQNRGRICRA